jgi:hypothetical protein
VNQPGNWLKNVKHLRMPVVDRKRISTWPGVGHVPTGDMRRAATIRLEGLQRQCRSPSGKIVETDQVS